MRFLSLLFLLPCLAWAKFEVPGFELVYTAPVETSLEAQDLRDPVTVWGELIDGAKKEIVFEQMYASGKKGEPLDSIIEKLAAASARGVKIRFLMEKKTQRASIPETVAALQAIKGLELRYVDYAKVSGDGIIHAKFFVVDGKHAYVGSQNFDWRSLKHIHETGLLISFEPITKQMQAIFEQDWKAAGLLEKGAKSVAPLNKKEILAPSGLQAYLVASPNAFNPKGVGSSEAELPRLIAEAKNEIRIMLLDYAALNRDHSYYGVIDQALRAAQAKGVKIKLLVSHWNQDKPEIYSLKSLAVLPQVEVKIAQLPEAKEGFIPFARVNHSKIMSIDNRIAWVGTSNWTGGYLDHSRNLEVVIKNGDMAKRVADLHEQLWSSSHSKPLDVMKEYPKPAKAAKE